MKFEIVFKKGVNVVRRVPGQRSLKPEDLTLREAEQILETEKFLEKLTGLRVWINQIQ
jgi:hypothetical protein